MQPALRLNYTTTTAVKSDLHAHFQIQVSRIKTQFLKVEHFVGAAFRLW